VGRVPRATSVHNPSIMEALYLLIPLSVAIVALAVWIFLRMLDSGQFDDMEGPAHSILLDDDSPRPPRPQRRPEPPKAP
jgi:cbb3-type cytochrome oxidase maturation protein